MLRALTIASMLLTLNACVTKIATPDQMREAVLADRIRDVRHAVRDGFPAADDVAYCFPLVPFAAATGHARILLAILAEPNPGVRIDQPNCMGHTALHFAALTGDRRLERELLARGADPTARDHRARTPGDLRDAAGVNAVAPR